LLTNHSLNGNRALATDIVQHDFPHYIWIYQVAPVIGGIGAAGLYKTVEFLQSLRKEIPDTVLGPELAAFSTAEQAQMPTGTKDHMRTIEEQVDAESSTKKHRRKRSDHMKLSMTGQNQIV
jgi:hypothetical protein